MRLRRSILYVPGGAEDKLRKAGRRGADVLVLDLEDGVHPERKDEARRLVVAACEGVDFGGAEVWIRVNRDDTPWGDADLAAVRGLGVAGVVLPKVESAEAIVRARRRLGDGPALFLMIETAAGVLRAASLARATEGLGGLVFGSADYRASLRAGASSEEDELAFARATILHAARAAGLDAFDAPWFRYADTAGLAESARRVRRLGFDGKTAIHPIQVPVLNRVFTPEPGEIERARRVVAAMEDALGRGLPVATLDGEMIEALHLDEARRILARAAAAGVAPEEA